MPVNFQANFSELNRKCPDNYYEKMRTPGCLLGAKPFTPFAKGPPVITPVITPPATTSFSPQPTAKPIATFNTPSFSTQNILASIVSASPNDESSQDITLYSGRGNAANSVKNIMESYHNQMKQENPTMSIHDRIMAEMAAAAYIHNDQQLDTFVNETSHIAESGYTLNKEMTAKSRGLMLVFEKEGKPTLAFRGTEKWVGQDGVSNFTNATGITRAGQALRKATGASNPLTSDQNTIDNLMADVYAEYNQVPEDFTGHSLGGARAKLARLWFRNNYRQEFTNISEHKVTGFMPAPGGGSKIHADDGAYKVWATEFFDPVALVDRIQMTVTGQRDVVNIVRSTKGYGILGSHNVENMTGGVSIADAEPGTAPTTRQPIGDNLEMRPGLITERVTAGTRAFLKEAPGQASSLVTGLAAGAITRSIGLAPDSQTGLITTSALNTTLDAAVAGSAAGMSTTAASMIGGATARVALSEGAAAALGASASAASTLALPTLAAYEAANSVGQAIDRATAGWRDQGAAHALSGGLAGTTAAVTGLTANMATGTAVNVFRAVRTARAGYSAVAVAAEGAGALAAGEETAAYLALVPIPGFRLLAGAVAIGTLLGVGLGWLFGPHDSPEEQQRKASEHQHEIEAKFDEIQNKFETSYSHHNLDLDSLQGSLLDPESVLSPEEVAFMNAHSSNEFFQSYHQNVSHAWETERRARDIMTSLNRRRSMNPFFGIDQLSGGEQVFLHQRHHEDVLHQIQSSYDANMAVVTDQAERLNVPVQQLIKLYGDHHRGFTGGRARTPFTDEDFTNQIDTLEANALSISLEEYQSLKATDEASREDAYNSLLQQQEPDEEEPTTPEEDPTTPQPTNEDETTEE